MSFLNVLDRCGKRFLIPKIDTVKINYIVFVFALVYFCSQCQLGYKASSNENVYTVVQPLGKNCELSIKEPIQIDSSSIKIDTAFDGAYQIVMKDLDNKVKIGLSYMDRKELGFHHEKIAYLYQDIDQIDDNYCNWDCFHFYVRPVITEEWAYSDRYFRIPKKFIRQISFVTEENLYILNIEYRDQGRENYFDENMFVFEWIENISEEIKVKFHGVEIAADVYR